MNALNPGKGGGGGGGDRAIEESIVLDLRPAPGSLVIRGFWPVAACVAIVAGGITMAVLDWYATVGLWASNAAIVLALAALVWRAAERRATRYVLTTRRLAWHEGVLARYSAEAILGAVQNVLLTRSLVERVLGLGTVGVATAGTEGYEIVWRHVASPENVLSAIRGALDRWTPEPNERGPGTAASGADIATAVPASTGRGLRSIPVIGLAGGIGSGKSHVARELGRLGCYVIDSDARAKAALDRPEVAAELVRWWGERVLGTDGRVDRGRVAEVIFGDPVERARLEALVHPIVRQDRARLIEEASEFWPKAVVVDAPLLFEAGVDKECDAVVFVDAPREDRVERVRRARGWDEAELDRREAAQWPLERKRGKSPFIVQNAGQTADLVDQLSVILERVRSIAAEAEPTPGGRGRAAREGL